MVDVFYTTLFMYARHFFVFYNKADKIKLADSVRKDLQQNYMIDICNCGPLRFPKSTMRMAKVGLRVDVCVINKLQTIVN